MLRMSVLHNFHASHIIAFSYYRYFEVYFGTNHASHNLSYLGSNLGSNHASQERSNLAQRREPSGYLNVSF